MVTGNEWGGKRLGYIEKRTWTTSQLLGNPSSAAVRPGTAGVEVVLVPRESWIVLYCFEFLISLVFMLINALGDSLNYRDGSAGEISGNGRDATGGEDWER